MDSQTKRPLTAYGTRPRSGSSPGSGQRSRWLLVPDVESLRRPRAPEGQRGGMLRCCIPLGESDESTSLEIRRSG